MKKSSIKLLKPLSTIFFLAFSSSVVWSKESVIQQQKMLFETCLEVIATSESKLSISPKISNISDQNRVAIFEMSDGSLKITCDGKKGLLTVSTKQK